MDHLRCMDARTIGLSSVGLFGMEMRWPSRNTAIMLGGRVQLRSKLRNEVRWLMYRSASADGIGL